VRQDFELRTTKAWTINSQTLVENSLVIRSSMHVRSAHTYDPVTRDESISRTSILSTFPVRYVPFNRSSSSPETLKYIARKYTTLAHLVESTCRSTAQFYAFKVVSTTTFTYFNLFLGTNPRGLICAINTRFQPCI